MRPVGEEFNVYVHHQAGSRLYRKEIGNQLKRCSGPIFGDVEMKPVLEKAEAIHNKAEELWINQHAKDIPKFDFPLN